MRLFVHAVALWKRGDKSRQDKTPSLLTDSNQQLSANRASKLVQQVKVLAGKPDDLSSMLGTHGGSRETAPQYHPLISTFVLWQAHAQTHTPEHTGTHTNK